MNNNIIALAGKEDTDKSTTAVKLWLALNHTEKSTLLVDCMPPIMAAEQARAQLLHMPELFTHVQVRNIFDSLAGLSIEAQDVYSKSLTFEQKLKDFGIYKSLLNVRNLKTFSILNNAKSSLVVVKPDHLSMTEELRTRHSLTNAQRIIPNKSTTSLSEKFFHAPLIGSLPEYQKILHAALKQSLAHLLPEHDFTTRINQLAQKCIRL